MGRIIKLLFHPSAIEILLLIRLICFSVVDKRHLRFYFTREIDSRILRAIMHNSIVFFCLLVAILQ